MGGPRLTVVRLHRQIEKMIEESGTPFTFLRPNFFMQNFVNFHLHTIKEQGAFCQFMVDSPVSLVDIRDIAAVAVQALTNNKDSKHPQKHILLQDQKRFLMKTPPRFCLSKLERKYLM